MNEDYCVRVGVDVEYGIPRGTSSSLEKKRPLFLNTSNWERLEFRSTVTLLHDLLIKLNKGTTSNFYFLLILVKKPIFQKHAEFTM